jgi:hypothetical protein
MNHSSFNDLRHRVEFTSQLRYSRVQVFKEQAVSPRHSEPTCLSQQDIMNKETLMRKGLRSFDTLDSRPTKLKRLVKRASVHLSSSDLHVQGTHNDSLPFNKSKTSHHKSLVCQPIILKRIPLKFLEPLEYSRSLAALRPVQNFNKLRSERRHLRSPETSDFALIEVRCSPPHYSQKRAVRGDRVTSRGLRRP